VTRLPPVGVLLAFVIVLLGLAGCDGGKPTPPRYTATDITGIDYARDFSLTDHNGRPRTLGDFRGKLVAVFFGYTHCPDVCPTTLSDFALAMNAMAPEEAAKVQVLFVSVDPERDTPELLRRYVPAFHPGFLGLHGDAGRIADTAREFKIFYQKSPHGDGYLIDHSAGTYVFDRQGRPRLYMAYGQGPEAIVQDLRQLLAE
jgi:protein SCO1/2